MRVLIELYRGRFFRDVLVERPSLRVLDRQMERPIPGELEDGTETLCQEEHLIVEDAEPFMDQDGNPKIRVERQQAAWATAMDTSYWATYKVILYDGWPTDHEKFPPVRLFVDIRKQMVS